MDFLQSLVTVSRFLDDHGWKTRIKPLLQFLPKDHFVLNDQYP